MGSRDLLIDEAHMALGIFPACCLLRFAAFFLKYLWTKFFWGPNFFWQTFFWPKIKLIHQNEVNNVPVWAELGIAQPQFDINFNRNLMWHLILFLKTIIKIQILVNCTQSRILTNSLSCSYTHMLWWPDSRGTPCTQWVTVWYLQKEEYTVQQQASVSVPR